MASNPITARPPKFSSSSQVPITSRWCNRALRPLTSIFLRLEKHWKSAPIETEKYIRRTSDGIELKRSKSRNNDGRAAEPRVSGGGAGSESESARDDPTWIPGKGAKKRIKHKYSGRKDRSSASGRSRVVVRSPEVEKLRPGEFTVATPLILGRRQRLDDGTGEEDGSLAGAHCRAASPKRKASRKDWSYHQRLDDDVCDIYNDPFYIGTVQSIFGVWDTFLRVTSPQQEHSSCGARSLLSMSLTAASEYILQEHEHANKSQDKEEESSVANFIFTELEGTYALGNGGWKPLKELVRSHGINLICEAIRRKWVSPQLSRKLILNAMYLSADDAAVALLSSLLSVSPIIPSPKHLDSTLFSSETSVALHTLDIYVQRTGSLGVMFQELASLLVQGLLPAEWMATSSMKRFLTKAFHSISYGDKHSLASVQFITAMVLTASETNGLPESLVPKPHQVKPQRKSVRKFRNTGAESNDILSTALTNTILSVLAVLSGTHFARFGFGSLAVSTMHYLVVNLSTIVQKNIEQIVFDRNSNNQKLHPTRACAILMADFLLNYVVDDKETITSSVAIMHNSTSSSPLLHNTGYFIRLLSNKKELMSDLSTLILHIARCLGRVQEDDGFDVVKRFTNAFEFVDLKQYPTVRIVFNNLAVEVALNYAELTCSQDHHDWAAYVQDKVADCDFRSTELDGLGPLTPSFCRPATGFRWEDGIGEWVAKTPNMRKLQSSLLVSPLPSTMTTRGLQNTYSDTSDASNSEDGDSNFSWGSQGRNLRYESSVTSDYTSPPVERKRKQSTSQTRYARNKRTRVMSRKNKAHDNSSYLRRSQRQTRKHLNFDYDSSADSNGSVARGLSSCRKGLMAQSKVEEGQGHALAVSVEVPPPSNRVCDVEVVIMHERNKHDVNSRYVDATSEDNTNGSDPAGDDDDDAEDEDEDEDEDIFDNAPSLGERIRQRMAQSGSFSSSTPPSSSSSLNRGKQPYLLRSTRLSLTKRVIPCSDSADSSDDELSFM